MSSLLKKKHLKIDLGSGDPKDGESSPGGYLKQDVDPTIAGLDIICNIEELDKHLSPESCAKIRISHALEHFPVAQIPVLMKMFYNLLEDGGELEVIVPNFLYHVELCLMGEEEKAIYYAFGGQLDEWDFHKTAFTPKILKKRFEEVGFFVVSSNKESSFTMIGQK
jgi:predicted SAM-dependent methyltransferase